jgi:hypothetical protein
MSEAEFFGGGVEKQIAPWELDPEQFATARLIDELQSLPKHSQRALLAKFQLMVETASDVHEPRQKRPPRYMRDDPQWQMLASRN